MKIKLFSLMLCALLFAAPTVDAKGSHSRARATKTTKPRKTKPASSNNIPCKDGTTSHAKHTQGACGHHGGIK